MVNGDNTFIQITNKEIYAEIRQLRKTFDELNDNLIKTNEKIQNNCEKLKFHQKLIIGAYGFGMTILGIVLAYLIG